MKEKIHPNYGEVTATCACGASFVTGSTKKNYAWMFALNAIHSSLVNNVTLLLVAVLKNSTNATTKNNNLAFYSRACNLQALLYLYIQKVCLM